ncbi:MAG: hypothetical protein ACE5EA_02460 [Nitrospirota bacterium]
MDIDHDLSLDEIMKFLEEERKKIDTFKGLLSGRIKENGTSSSFYAALYLYSGKNQDLLEDGLFIDNYIRDIWRLKVFNRIGFRLLDIIFRSNRFKLYIPSKDKWIEGDILNNNLFIEESNTTLPIINIMNIIGLPPPGIISIDKIYIPVLEAREDYYILSLFIRDKEEETAMLRKRLWIKRDNLVLDKEEIFDRYGRVSILIYFEDYDIVSDIYIPYKIRVIWERENRTISLRFTEIYLNILLKKGDFEIR